MNRYEKLAEMLEQQIRKGWLTPGQRLPSVRDLSAREGVSASTVVEAYALLQERGVIESRERSGFFVSSKEGYTALPEGVPEAKLLSLPINVGPDDFIFAIRQSANDPKIIPFGTATPYLE